MGYTTVTYTFANSTTADATQVNQNFTDILNGLSDGTKNFNISALTCAGATVLNGAVTLGDGTPDDITVNGSLASSLPIKTTFSYDLGSSTVGWKSFYLGSNDSAARTTRVIAGAVGSSYTLTLPTGPGSAGQGLRNLGSGSLAFLSTNSLDILNAGLAASVGSSALTVSLKGADGNDPSATNPVYITFRNATLTTGTPVTRAVTGALSVVVSSGSTLGHASGSVTQYVYVYAIDNAGTVELAVSGQKISDEGGVISTTAEGGAGAADSGTVLYSTTARSNVACRLIGRLTSTQATAGTWATAISEITGLPFENKLPRCEIHLSNGNGFGATSSKIRRFTTVQKDTSSAAGGFTWSDDSNLGTVVTITRDGLYFASYSDTHTAADYYGISLNSASLTTPVNSLGASEAICITSTTASASPTEASFIGVLRAGDVIRPHGSQATSNSTVFNQFRVIRVI
jgi:hypothetical protein